MEPNESPQPGGRVTQTRRERRAEFFERCRASQDQESPYLHYLEVKRLQEENLPWYRMWIRKEF